MESNLEALIVEAKSVGFEAAERALGSLFDGCSNTQTAIDNFNSSMDAAVARASAAGAAFMAEAEAIGATAAAINACNTAAATAASANSNVAATSSLAAASTTASTTSLAANAVALQTAASAALGNAAAVVSSTVAMAASTVASTASAAAMTAASVATKVFGAGADFLGSALSRLKSTASSLVATMILIGGPVLAVHELIRATQAYQDYEANLRIATKSAEGAQVAFQALQDYAQKTPYSIQQSVDAFIKLVNFGLTPSERALTSYGNTASSMGKSLDQMVQAVAQATNNHFMRLKEFGILSRQEGDKVIFTYRGVKEAVQKNASAIEEYLIRLGENNFAGSMAERMSKLTGVLSNLRDTWDTLMQNIMSRGPGDFVTDQFRKVLTALTDVNNYVASGEMEAHITAFGMKWGDTGTAIKGTLVDITNFFGNSVNIWGLLGEKATAYLNYAWEHLPQLASMALQQTADTFWRLVDVTKVVASSIVDGFEIEFTRLVDMAKATGALVGDALSGKVTEAWTKYASAMEAANTRADASAQQLKNSIDQQFAGIAEAHDSVQKDITKDTFANIENYDKEIDKAKELRKQYEATAEERRKNPADRLAQFKTGVSGDDDTPGKPEKAGRRASQQALKDELGFLEQGLTTQFEVIASNYKMRKDLIINSTTLTEKEKQEKTLQILAESLVTEEDNIKQSYEQRKAIILASSQLTADQQNSLLVRLTEARERQLTQVELAHQRERLSSATTFFGNIASIGSAFGRKGFAISKAAAIAQATIKTYEAATGAYAALAGIPYVGPALGIAAAAAAIAAGAANIANIKSQNYSGAYATGGMIPAGSYGLVGEAGPEFVEGPAIVTSAASTAAARSGGAKATTVVIQNFGQPVTAESSTTPDGDMLLILKPILAEQKRQIKREIAGEFTRGGGDITAAAENAYGLRRGGSA
jgi:Tape measure protein